MYQTSPVAYAASSPQEMKDLSHLKTLAICHYVLGGLTMLISCVFLIHVALGIAMVSGVMPMSPPPGQASPPFPPAYFGLIFIVAGSLAVLFGWSMGILTIISGRHLHTQRRRTFSVVIAGIDCLSFPLGTILGIFTFIVLSRPSVIQLYAARQHDG